MELYNIHMNAIELACIVSAGIASIYCIRDPTFIFMNGFYKNDFMIFWNCYFRNINEHECVWLPVVCWKSFHGSVWRRVRLRSQAKARESALLNYFTITII